MKQITPAAIARVARGMGAATVAATLAACGPGGDPQDGAATPTAAGIGVGAAAGAGAPSAAAGGAALAPTAPKALDGTLAQTYSVTNIVADARVALVRINALAQVLGREQPADPAAPPRYFLWSPTAGRIDVGTLGGSSVEVSAINDQGQAVGTASLPGERVRHAFAWTAQGGMVDLGPLIGPGDSFAQDVNDRGQILGRVLAPGATEARHFVLTPPRRLQYLQPHPGRPLFEARRLNDLGQVLGTDSWRAPNGEPYSSALFWERADAAPVDIGRFPQAPPAGMPFHSVYPHFLNDAGQAAGWMVSGFNLQWSFLWSGADGLLNATPERRFTWSEVAGLNDAGLMAVNMDLEFDTGPTAWTWSRATGGVPLGSLGGGKALATGINRQGLVVGSAVAADGRSRAFAWTRETGMVDLNARLADAPDGLELTAALGVSDNGSIVAASDAGLVLLGPPAAAPVVGPIRGARVVAAGSRLELRSRLTDADLGDTHTAFWDWGDGTPPAAGIVTARGGGDTVGGTAGGTAGGSTASGTHAYAAPGLYRVRLTVTDGQGLSTAVTRDVVVHDAFAGFAAGGGRIESPAGAYRLAPSAFGPATFVFLARASQRGDDAASAAFALRAGELRFVSRSVRKVVLSADRVRLEGTGTVNGRGGHRFALTAVDGDLGGKPGADRLRLQIWAVADGGKDTLVYDNLVATPGGGADREGSALAGGEIVIRRDRREDG